MRNFTIGTLLAVTLVIGMTPAMAQNRPQTVNVPLSRPGEPIQLDIQILSARIEVIGEDRQDASFELSVTDGKRKIVTPSGAQTIIGGGYAFEIDEDDNEISLDTDWRATKVSVVARVPRRADVELHTVNDGELFISNITGNIELYNTNGPIIAKNITGSVIAESINDTIDVSFREVNVDNASSFESINGDLYLRIPAKAGVEVHLDSAKGEIFSDFEVEIVPTEKSIKRDEDGSGTSIRIENVLVARINGGGPAVRMKTLNGDIHIRKAE